MATLGRFGLVAAMTLAVLAAMALPTEACGCVAVVAPPGQQTRPPSFEREVAIFSAHVVEQSLLKGTVTFDVIQAWKGELTYLTTMPILSGSNCEFSFEVGTTYLIFGLGDSIVTMRAKKCTRTAPLEDAGAALEMLKAVGYRPRQPQLR